MPALPHINVLLHVLHNLTVVPAPPSPLLQRPKSLAALNSELNFARRHLEDVLGGK